MNVEKTLFAGPAGSTSSGSVTRGGAPGCDSGSAASGVSGAHGCSGCGARKTSMIPITRTCGRLLSYVAVSRNVSPAATGIPAADENVVMCFGPFSCITGWITGSPQVGSDSNSVRPLHDDALRSLRTSFSPPPWMCAPPATSRPPSGSVKSECCEYVENMGPSPGTLKIGSDWQLRTSSQIGFTAISDSSVTYLIVYWT